MTQINRTQYPVKVCTRCVMNSLQDPLITFDSGGVCNHCRRYDDCSESRMALGKAGADALAALIEKIKRVGCKSEYDCLIGVSGGVDSTYVAYLVKQLGLRPLAVHFDNGWNSELAVHNIEKILSKLGIDLYTYVVDWGEFRDLQIAFLKSSTPDGEIPNDHGIFALLWREASRRGIRYIISGMNFHTESISVMDWAYGHADWRYVRDVHRKFGSRPLKTYPHFSLMYLIYINCIKRIRTVSILNYVKYNKEEAVKLLESQLGWTNYGGKHHESVYTRFFQGYVLPHKFGIDKRHGHLSDLINCNQITRQDAIAELAKPTYPLELQKADLDYVIKKLGLTHKEFEELMKLPRKSFRDYNNSFALVLQLKRLVNFLRSKGIYPK